MTGMTGGSLTILPFSSLRRSRMMCGMKLLLHKRCGYRVAVVQYLRLICLAMEGSRHRLPHVLRLEKQKMRLCSLAGLSKATSGATQLPSQSHLRREQLPMQSPLVKPHARYRLPGEVASDQNLWSKPMHV